MNNKLFKLVLFILSSSLMFTQNISAQPAAMNCDRACLINILEDYMEAVITDNPRATSLAASYRGTENAIDVEPGEGFWQSSTEMGDMAHYYADPVNQSAAFYGLVNEGNEPAIVSLRLQTENQQITEAEWVIARAGESLVNFDGIKASQPIMQSLPRRQWSSRESMITAANAYFDALVLSDPDFVVPSVDGCPRIENGTMVTGGGPVPEAEEAVEFERGDCTDGLERMTQISGIVERIFPVVDQQAGVVLGRGVFNRPPGAARRDGSLWPRNYLMEYFSIEDGRISGIYAAMHYLPADSAGSSW